MIISDSESEHGVMGETETTDSTPAACETEHLVIPGRST